ncbi:hypothetical protein [Ectopseudomonas hydrolytica]|uniref:hypothetical protein n=1 Tax=Ectopseudomonas hydrolytica TaxID=2493633 RepID=UPI0020B74EDF|nr:hypothetical protein [Pseudomonas hydrolytica]UTH29370.1 hypothetical protein NLY38_12905 [Pseudomonas hydrolytica]UTH29385.1 hypothetical protein NLY38_12980 [Pseudomonas hydrolytica]
MKILRGFVKGVVNRGTEEKPWCYVGIETVSQDRDGFDQVNLVKFMVAGNQFKEGLQNAYRNLIGTEVFAPYSDEIDYFNNKARIRYSLQGVPLRLQEVTRERPAVAPASTQQPAKTA